MIQGLKIKQQRESLGLTQWDLAEKRHVTVHVVNQWERTKVNRIRSRLEGF